MNATPDRAFLVASVLVGGGGPALSALENLKSEREHEFWGTLLFRLRVAFRSPGIEIVPGVACDKAALDAWEYLGRRVCDTDEWYLNLERKLHRAFSGNWTPGALDESSPHVFVGWYLAPRPRKNTKREIHAAWTDAMSARTTGRSMTEWHAWLEGKD